MHTAFWSINCFGVWVVQFLSVFLQHHFLDDLIELLLSSRFVHISRCLLARRLSRYVRVEERVMPHSIIKFNKLS
jgi:hypothetical protein